MSAPMPVMKSAMVTESGSTRNPKLTWKPPTWSQSNRL